jgi:hypothetical protein
MRKPHDLSAIFKWLIIIHRPIWSLFWTGVVLFFSPLRLRWNVKNTSLRPRAHMKYVLPSVWNHTRRLVKGKRTNVFSRCIFDLETGWTWDNVISWNRFFFFRYSISGHWNPNETKRWIKRWYDYENALSSFCRFCYYM